jgi:hypothetical protein
MHQLAKSRRMSQNHDLRFASNGHTRNSTSSRADPCGDGIGNKGKDTITPEDSNAQDVERARTETDRNPPLAPKSTHELCFRRPRSIPRPLSRSTFTRRINSAECRRVTS